MKGWALVVVLIAVAQPVLSRNSAPVSLHVQVIDGEPLDQIILHHSEGCGSIVGRLQIDFSTAQGQIFFDTLPGDPGFEDSAPVEVTKGPVKASPVEDGARSIDIQINGLTMGARGILTLDIDKSDGLFEANRIQTRPGDLDGAVLRFRPDLPVTGGPYKAVFGPDGQATIVIPALRCGGM